MDEYPIAPWDYFETGIEVWRHVTLAAKFLDHNNAEIKQRRW